MQVADGGEMTTIDGTPVSFITENEISVRGLIDSTSQSKAKINDVVENIQDADEGIIIQTVDATDTNLTNVKIGGSQGTEDEQINKNWIYLATPQQEGTEASTLSSALENDENVICKILSADSYKLDLLQRMFEGENMQSFADLVVFCNDGVAWTSRLLMSAASEMIREAYNQLDVLQGETTSIVLPDITKQEFNIFHEALFASVKDTKLDLVTVIKVAETLRVDLLPIETSLPIQKERSDGVDYKIAKENSEEWRRVLSCLGYDSSCGPHDTKTDIETNHSKPKTMSELVSIFDKSISCGKCHRTFGSEVSLKNHMTMIHNSSRNINSHLTKKYSCGKCDQSFAFAINVRKHQWMCHRKGMKHILRLNNSNNQEDGSNDNDQSSTYLSEELDGHLDKRARKKKALQEKIEDMTCKDCGLKCTSWKQLQIHTMDHSNERPFKCKLCQKGFKEPQKLKRHMVSHTREKQFSCKYCQKSFGLKHNMKTHEKIHEGGGYHCSYCDRTFSQNNTLQDHEMKHRKLKHVKTKDENLRTRQLLKAVRGRPSLKESFQKQGKSIHDVISDNDKTADDTETYTLSNAS